MKAITFENFGGPEVLRLTEVADPEPGPEQVLVRVRASALNRADLLQRLGKYPPPVGESEILGLEVAGEIEAIGRDVTGCSKGDRVFSLVGGGGYAEKAVVNYRLALPIPEGWSFNEAAAVPEAFLTGQETLFTLGALRKKEIVLIHAAGSGVGTASVQMARLSGACVLVTAGTKGKIQKALELGAEAGCLYTEKDFEEWIREQTNGKGVDLIQDPIGAAYWDRNVQCLKENGRLVLFGLMGGVKREINLGILLTKRLTVMGTVMRSRPLLEKQHIIKRFQEQWLPRLASGAMHPVIDSTFPLRQAAEAHRYMEENKNVGKIVLEV